MKLKVIHFYQIAIFLSIFMGVSCTSSIPTGQANQFPRFFVTGQGDVQIHAIDFHTTIKL